MRASRTFQMECRRLLKRREETGALAAPHRLPAKGFDAADLGQGRKGGGGLFYRRARLNLRWRRVIGLFRKVPEIVGAGMDRNWQRWDAVGAHRFGLARGHFVKYEMLKLNSVAQEGDNHTLVLFCQKQMRIIAQAEITV